MELPGARPMAGRRQWGANTTRATLHAQFILPATALRAYVGAVLFERDDAKHERNRRGRGFGFDHAVRIFAKPVLERADTRRSYGEVRVQALGETGGNVLVVVYTDRGEARRIISALRASRKERELWQSRA